MAAGWPRVETLHHHAPLPRPHPGLPRVLAALVPVAARQLAAAAECYLAPSKALSCVSPEVLRLADAPSQPSLVPEHQSETSINTVNARRD